MHSAWLTLYMTWICTYSRLLYSQKRLNRNRIPYFIPPPPCIQHVEWSGACRNRCEQARVNKSTEYREESILRPMRRRRAWRPFSVRKRGSGQARVGTDMCMNRHV